MTHTTRSSVLGMSLAALGTVLVHALSRYLMKVYPFGQSTAMYGDFGPQYLPFYARMREQLVGGELSGWFFSWSLGVGAPSLADYTTYLGGPFTPLIALFPAERVLTGIIIIIGLRLALAAALMYLLITKIASGLSHYVALALAIAYGTTAWVADLGFFTLQWLDGYWALPALCLVALSCYRNPSFWQWIWAPLVVGIAWWSNYYTAYMSSAFSGLFLITVLLATAPSVKTAITSLTRFVLCGLLGVMLAAPFLAPTIWALYNGVGRTAGLSVRPTDFTNVVVRLLPFTQGDAFSPNLYASSLALIVASTVVAAPHLTRRARVTWVTMSAVMLYSLFSAPLLLMWNLFQTPHGSVYRWAYVIAAWIILTAALAWPSKQALWRDTAAERSRWFNTAQVVIACLACYGLWAASKVVPKSLGIYVGQYAWTAALWCIPLVLGWLSNAWNRRATQLLVAIQCLAAVCLFVEVTYSTAWTRTQAREYYGELQYSVPQEASRLAQTKAAVASLWPRYRLPEIQWLDTDPWWVRDNGSARYSYPGLSYYSSTVQAKTSHALVGLGYPLVSEGRHLQSPKDHVLEALLSAYREDFVAFPMVRVTQSIGNNDQLPEAFQARNQLAGTSALYTQANVEIRSAGGDVVARDRQLTTGQEYTATLSCPVGSFIVAETAELAQASEVVSGASATDFLTLGAEGVSRDKYTVIDFTANKLVKKANWACLNLDALREEVKRQQSPEKIDIAPGRISAQFSQPVSGPILVATPAVEGWSCSLDHAPARLSPTAGFLSVEAKDASSLECRYQPPLFRAGMVAAIAAALSMVALATWHHRRKHVTKSVEAENNAQA